MLPRKYSDLNLVEIALATQRRIERPSCPSNATRTIVASMAGNSVSQFVIVYNRGIHNDRCVNIMTNSQSTSSIFHLFILHISKNEIDKMLIHLCIHLVDLIFQSDLVEHSINRMPYNVVAQTAS